MECVPVNVLLLSIYLLILSSDGYTSMNWDFPVLSTSECNYARCNDDRSGGPWQCDIHTHKNCYAEVASAHCDYRCKCDACRTDCSLNEGIAAASADKCNIADIPSMKSDITGDITDVVTDVLIGLIPDPFAAGAMSLGVEILRMFEDTEDPMDILISEINDMASDLEACIDQKIADLEAGNRINEMETALDDYNDAMGTGTGSSVENKRDMVYLAWDSFTDIQYTLNDIIGKEPTYFQRVLGPLQYFSAFFAVTATEYLIYLDLYDTDVTKETFYNRLDTTLHAMNVISIWTHVAKATIAADYMDALQQMPCGNGASLDTELANWMEAFDEAHIRPINGYLQQIHRLKRTDENVCELENIDILSVDHYTGTTGMYFNFDASIVDKKIFGGKTDWNTVVLDMDYKGKTITVVLWRYGNGGTYPWMDQYNYPPGHGRIEPKSAKAEYQFVQWDSLIFRKELCGV